MQWFKRHPAFLRDESTKLSNDSNYRESSQKRDNLFVSCGYILVRLDKLYKYPIVIIYTDATPYQLPLIFPLKEGLTEEELKHIASLTVSGAITYLNSKIKYYYELRHQNAGGSLCIVEWDSLDEGSKFYGINSILKRLRDWYAGHTTGKYPPDNQEVEFCAHFKEVSSDTDFLYPEEFLKENLVAGKFYATLIKQTITYNTYIYYGCLIDGVNKSGIYENDGVYLFSKPLNDKLLTSSDFQNNSSLVDSYIAKGQLISGLWFHVDKPLTPFTGFNSLVTIIGNGDYDLGVKRIHKAHFFSSLFDTFFIGLRYLNKRGKLEFQVFKVHKSEVSHALILTDTIEKTKSILSRYDKVEAIPSEKLASENFHARNSTRAKYEVLKDTKVNVLGVGALGSEIADCLGKAGIGTMVIVDDQEIKPHNPVRHLAGLGYVGVPKVDAVKELVADHNPFINIHSWRANLLPQVELIYHLPQDSITVSAVADDNVEGLINEHSLIAGNPVFYVRALRGGKVGRIFRVIPGVDACFHCLSLYMKEAALNLKVPEDTELPTIKNECNNPVRPASAADLKLISALASRIVIDHLQEGKSESNHWIWSSETLLDVNISSPYTVNSQFVPPHPNCFYCNYGKEIEVSISKSAIESMKALVAERKGVETGGVLAGTINDDGSIYITHASEPGPNATHNVTEFKKDVPFCQAFLDDLYQSSSQEIVYVGEWHSHPNENNRPSGIDIKSLSDISMQKEYLTTSPVMIIFSNSGKPSCSIHPAGKRHYFTNLNIKE